MVSNSDSRVYSEVIGIINVLGDNYKNALPKNMYKYFYDNRAQDYNPTYDFNEKLALQKLSKKATALVCFLHYKYWCETEVEKEKINKILFYNEKKKNLRYNTDNIFINNITKEVNQPVQLVEYKENILKKIWNKIKFLFTRR